MTGVLRFDGVCAKARSGHRTTARLSNLTGQFGGGVHLVIGEVDDGVETLFSIASGHTAPQRGSVWLDGRQPHREPQLRRRIGLLDVDASLPEGETVGACLAHFLRWRPEASDALVSTPDSWFSPERAVTTLTAAQKLGLAWRLALAPPEPTLLLLHDPFRFGSDALSEDSAAAQLRGLSDRGTIVVITAPRAGSYFAMADSVYLLGSGRLQGGVSLLQEARHARLTVRLDPRVRGDARRLAVALSEHDSVRGVQWSERPHEANVRVEFAQLEEGAMLVAEVVSRLGSSVVAMAPATPTRGELEALVHAERMQRGGGSV